MKRIAISICLMILAGCVSQQPVKRNKANCIDDARSIVRTLTAAGYECGLIVYHPPKARTLHAGVWFKSSDNGAVNYYNATTLQPLTDRELADVWLTFDGLDVDEEP